MKLRRGVAAALLISVIGLAAALLPTRRVQAAPNQVVQYQGRLVDSNGVPLEGTVRLTVRLYSVATPSTSTFVWGEVHEGIEVRRGVFTAFLGSGTRSVDADGNETPGPRPFTDEFDGSPRFVQVQVNADAPLSPLSPVGAVPYAISAGGSVPLGAVIPWWPPTPGAPVPAGFEYCDGSNVVTPGSPYTGLSKPDLMTTPRFLRGLPIADVATFGGSTAFPTGGSDAGAHRHAITAEGGHTHQVQGQTDPNTQTAILSGVDDFIGTQVTHNHRHGVNITSQSAGAHSHGGFTGGAVGLTPATSFDNRPAYLELVFLVRVQ